MFVLLSCVIAWEGPAEVPPWWRLEGMRSSKVVLLGVIAWQSPVEVPSWCCLESLCFCLFFVFFVVEGLIEGEAPRAGPTASRGTQARKSGSLASECLPSARVRGLLRVSLFFLFDILGAFVFCCFQCFVFCWGGS